VNSVDDFLTYIQREEDVCYLRTPLLPVSMRLFESSMGYREIIRNCCAYLKRVALMDLEGYKRPFGMSGANLGIPFNIVGVVYARNTPMAFCEVLLNPRIKEYQGPLEYSNSNCGSLRLAQNLEVLRYDNVLVRYHDEEGKAHERWFNRTQGSYTLQHEVDHNLGILITDSGRAIPDANRSEISRTID
jgi:peptide deformylase